MRLIGAVTALVATLATLEGETKLADLERARRAPRHRGRLVDRHRRSGDRGARVAKAARQIRVTRVARR